MTAPSSTPAGAVSCFAAVVMTPVPMGLVRTSASPGLAPRVGDLLSGADEPCDGHAVLGFLVVNGVASDDERAGLPRLGGAAFENTAQDVFRKADGEADDVQCQQGPGTHGVDIAEGVGGGDLPERKRVVDYGREEVYGLDESEVVVEAVDCGVVRGADPDEQVRIVDWGQMAQDLRQVVRTELGGSASAIGQLGKPYLAFYLCHDTLQWV